MSERETFGYIDNYNRVHETVFKHTKIIHIVLVLNMGNVVIGLSYYDDKNNHTCVSKTYNYLTVLCTTTNCPSLRAN